MSELILYVDTSQVHEGRLEELKRAMKELAEFVDTNVPRAIAYNVYFTEDGTRMTVAQLHPDPASLEYHMKVAGPAFPKLGEFLELMRIEIYGKPSDELLKLLRQKAELLGKGTVVVHDLHAGFARL